MKQFHLYRCPKTDKVKLFAFKIHAPKVMSDLQYPEQFIGSHVMHGYKMFSRGARKRAQVITERGDEQDKFYMTLRNQLLAELTEEEKKFSPEYIQNAMFLFIDRDKLEQVTDCLRLGALVNCAFKSGLTGLHFVKSERMTELLIKNQANVHALTPNKLTPLHMAASVEIAKKLIVSGAVIDALDDCGSTPFWKAAAWGKTTLVGYFISTAKVDVNAPNQFGESALHIAAQNGHLETVRILLESGAKVDVLNHNQCSPLYFASHCGHYNVVDLLIFKGANVNTVDNEGTSPLLLAAQDGYLNIVKKLLSVPGIKLHAIHKDSGFTALHAAAINGHMEVVIELLQYGANPMIPSRTKATPVMLTNNLEIKALIKKAELVHPALHTEEEPAQTRIVNNCRLM